MSAISFGGSPFAFDPIGMTHEQGAEHVAALAKQLQAAPARTHDDAVDAIAPRRCVRRYTCSLDDGHDGACSLDRRVFERCPRCNRPHAEHRHRFEQKRGHVYACPPRDRPGTNRPRRVST